MYMRVRYCMQLRTSLHFKCICYYFVKSLTYVPHTRFSPPLPSLQLVDYRVEFSKWWVAEFKHIKFPSQGTIFDYFLDHQTRKWLHWSEKVPKFTLDPEMPLQASAWKMELDTITRVSCPMSNIPCIMSQYHMSHVQHSCLMSNIPHLMSNIPCLMFPCIIFHTSVYSTLH